jgi:hypothetical protein
VINELPIAQRRANTYKKFVRVADDYVLKGPYTLFEKRFCRELSNKFCFDHVCHHFNILNIAIEILSVLTYQQTVFFIKYKKIKGMLDVVRTHLVRDSGGVDCDLIEKLHSPYKVSDSEESLLDVEMRKIILQHLYMRYIFGIGDIGTHNIIFNPDRSQVYGVDFEEMGGVRNPLSKLECLDKKKNSIKKKAVFEAYIDTIRQFDEEEIREVQEKLKEYFIDANHVIRRVKYFKTF